MKKNQLIKPIKRRNSIDCVRSKYTIEKQPQIYKKVEQTPNAYFDLIRYIYESFKDITQKSEAIELLANEIIKRIQPENCKVSHLYIGIN